VADVRKSLPLPAYLPDQLPGNALTIAQNVLPAADGYRAVKSYAAITAALPAAFMGGASFIASDGSAYMLVGTASSLEKLAAGAWTDLLTGLTVPHRWQFAQFGDNVVTVNGGVTEVVDLIAGTAAALAGAPSGLDVMVVGDHVIILGAAGNNALVKWSAFNDHTGWTPGINQSGFQPMLTGGEIKGGAGGEYGIILQRFRLVRMESTGDATAPFQFTEITNNYGCASSGSIAQAGRSVFFYSDRGFLSLEDGASITPIGNEKFDQSFRDAVSPDTLDQVWSAVDPKRSLVFWGIAGTPGTIWAYNWVLGKATTLSFPFHGFFPGFTTSLSLEEVSALYPNIDTMPYSLDDPRFQGGDPRLYFVGPDDTVGALSGVNLAAAFKFGFVSLWSTQVARINSAWPETDATTDVTVTVDAKNRLGDAEHITSSGMMQASGRVPLRCRGRYQSPGMAIGAGVDWSYAKAIGFDGEGAGVR